MSPVLHFAPEVLLAAQDVRAIFFDIDGVLTDGDIHFTEQGETLQRFNILDGQGLKLLRHAGITPVVIMARESAPWREQLATLGVDQVHGGVADKLSIVEQSLIALGLDWTQVAGVGHDWPDLPVLTRCALAAAPANAHVEVRAMAHHVTEAQSGKGAMRELCDLLLVAKGRYAVALAEATRSGMERAS